VSLVGLFGGSFDPVHHGHLIVAAAAAEALGLDELRFVPTSTQPLKPAGHHASAADRAAMLELAVAGRAGFAVERAEVERGGPSYTVETLRLLRAREPGADFVVLLGADAAAGLPRWREPEALAALARIAVFGRGGTAAAAGPVVWRTVPVPAIGISATEVRERVRTGRSVRYWVPDPVADYIAMHRLYLSHV
jgi:nicotinate-nucleotide adenylyltransferase